MKLGVSPKCPVCAKSVYKMEEVIGLGQTWHKTCFTCGALANDGTGCKRVLTRDGYSDHDGSPYCEACYGRHFKPKGFGYGNMLNTEVASRGHTTVTILHESAPGLNGPSNKPVPVTIVAAPSPTSSTDVYITQGVSNMSVSAPALNHAVTTTTKTTTTSAAPPASYVAQAPAPVNRPPPPPPPRASPAAQPAATVTTIASPSHSTVTTTSTVYKPGSVSYGDMYMMGAGMSDSVMDSFEAPAEPGYYSSTTTTTTTTSAPVATAPAPAATAGNTYVVRSYVTSNAGAAQKTAAAAVSQTPKCPVCTKSVYKMEEINGMGQLWHKSCFTCGALARDGTGCKRVLTRDGYSDHDGSPYCPACYGRHFKPKGFGYGNMLNTEVQAQGRTTATVVASSAPEARSPQAAPAPASSTAYNAPGGASSSLAAKITKGLW